MATTASIEASEIRRRGRRRLIGAIVLVILAVVFVPMILDSEPRQQRPEPSLEIPPKDKVAALPTPAAAPAKAVAPVETGAQKDNAQAAAKTEPPVPAEPAPARPKQAAEVPQASAQTAPPKLEGFAVQVGAFKEEAKLQSARDKLLAAKIPHFVEHRGDLNRLRAGPYPTREAAEKALASIKAASLEGQVVPLP
jgi:DedD protein